MAIRLNNISYLYIVSPRHIILIYNIEPENDCRFVFSNIVHIIIIM